VANAELDAAEVIRISPLDAPSLVDELATTNVVGPDGAPMRRRKLGGNALAHFGGFLDENWRLNDILWGRLDAAEVIVRSILMHPDDDPTDAVRAIHRAILSDLAEDVARRSQDRSPLRALLDVNSMNHSAAHEAARTQLRTCDALDVADEHSPLSAEHEQVIDDTATAFLDLLGDDGSGEPSWSVDLTMDNVRSSRGQHKITLLRRGVRVVGKVLALAGEDHYRIDSGELTGATTKRSSYELVGSLLVNTVMLAIGGPIRRIVITTLLAVAGLIGMGFTMSRAERGIDVVVVMIAATAAGSIGLLATQLAPSRRKRIIVIAGAFVAFACLVVAFWINWLTASACIVFFTVLALAVAFWFAVGWIRTMLIELGNPKPAPNR
jgi:hypothetical protein